jgi:hypothetical protein
MKIFWFYILELREMMNDEGYLKEKCMKNGEGVLYIATRVDEGQAQRANLKVKYKDCRKSCG